MKLSSRKSGIRPDGFQLVIFGLLGMIQIPTQLKIHPEVCRHSKELRQPQSRAWRDAPAPVDNLVNPLIRNVDGVCQFTLSDAYGNQKLFQKHFARMGWRSVCRNAYHFTTSKLVSGNPQFQLDQDRSQSTRNKSALVFSPLKMSSVPLSLKATIMSA